MKISYAITVCDETEEICQLIILLKNKVRKEDEIVILADYPKAPQQLKNLLEHWAHDEQVAVHKSKFDNNFSDWKNKLTQLCDGDYIFQIDADERPHECLIDNLPLLLKANGRFDVFLVPRVNIVTGIQSEDLIRWKWKSDEHGWINFPDYQWRIYRNHQSINWVNKVHERLDGFKTLSYLPSEEKFSLIHKKTINKQIKQNKFYDELI
jgi:hypothetical protein